jgi:sugar phosphate isomerase/epimerase
MIIMVMNAEVFRTMTPSIRIGLEAFTMPGIDAFSLVSLAALTGYTHVGVRLVDPTFNRPTLGSADARALAAHARRCGIILHGADLVDLEAPAECWEPILSVVAECGLTRIGTFHRGSPLAASDRFAPFVDAALPFGVVPYIEPVSYFGVRSIDDAARIVNTAAGGGITVDTLHFARSGDDLAALADVARAMPIWLQICDGPLLDGLAPPEAPVSERLARMRHESLSARLLPGDGVCAVADVARVVRENSPESELVLMVEAPNTVRIDEVGEIAYATLCHRAAEDVIREAITEGAA